MKKIFLTLTAALLAICLCGCDMLGQLEELVKPAPTTPAEALTEIHTALEETPGDLALTVHTAAGESFGPYLVSALPEMEDGMGRPLEKPIGLGRYKYWLTVSTESGAELLTVYVGENDLLCLHDSGEKEYYTDENGAISRPLRRCFDTLEYAYTQVRVAPPYPGAAVALREFASAVYPQLRTNLSPGSIYRFRDYDLFEYDVTESTNTTLTGTIVYAALPDSADSPILEQGTLMEDAGYEGYVLVTETVHLELHDDGFWYRTDAVI